MSNVRDAIEAWIEAARATPISGGVRRRGSAAARMSGRREPPTSSPLRVYYEDTDFSGVVYHASYLRFMERGRTEFIRSLGVDQAALHRETGILIRGAAHGRSTG